MSALNKLGTGLAMAALLLAVGCKFEDTTALGTEGKFDTKALDVYMGDKDRGAPQLQTVSNGQQPATDVLLPQATTAGEGPQPDQTVENTGVYGHWVAKIDMKAQMEKERTKMAADPNTTPEQRKAAEQFTESMAQALGAMMTFDLNVSKDKTFTMAMMGMPMKGTWVQNGDVMSLTPTEFMGMKPEDFAKKNGAQASVNDKPMLLKVAPDGKSLIAIDSKNGADTQDLVFKRA